jgi:long-chain acyl-CoA synthetase
MNIGSLGQDNIRKFGEYPNFYFVDRWYTNVELDRASNRLGNALKALGVKKGDRVAIQMPNSPVVLSSFTAIFKIGAVAVPVNPLLRPDQLAYIFKNCGATAVITSPEYIPWIEAAQKGAPELKFIILTERNDMPGTIYYDDIVASQPDSLKIEDMDNDDIATLIYTAGTTGPSKGVIHTHYSLYSGSISYADYLACHSNLTVDLQYNTRNLRTNLASEIHQHVSGFDRNDVSLFVLPLSHSYGLSILLVSFFVPAKGIIMKWFNPEGALKLIEEHRVTLFMGVPAMYSMILNLPNFSNYDLSSLRECSTGGAALPSDVVKQWKEKTGMDILEGWGMTETGAATCGNAPGATPKYGSIGQSMIKSNTMTILDNNDLELPAGATGEIAVKGPAIMKGYWNMPEETAETLRNGWLHTGDVGHRDDDGFFYITDRKKDIIIRGGENVSPHEVEEVLLQILRIREAGVIGVPDKVYGEEIKAFCVVNKDDPVTIDEIIAHCKKSLPTFKVPKTVEFVDSLPRNTMGKLMRVELRKREKDKKP